MNKIDRLTKLVSDADEAYKQSVIGVLDEIDTWLRYGIKTEDC